MTYFGARYYDPMVGRFMGRDPAGVREHIGANPMMFNRYAYGNNNPYRYVDPDGNSPLDVVFLAADVGKLSVAIYTGVGVGPALADVGMSAVGVVSPIPGTGQALKMGKLASAIKQANKTLGPAANKPVYQVSRSRTPEIAQNTEDAISRGAPTTLNRIENKSQIRRNRRAALRGQQAAGTGKSLDEYPFASCAQGGAGACVKAVPVGEQQIQAGDLSNFYRQNGIRDGDPFDVRVVD